MKFGTASFICNTNQKDFVAVNGVKRYPVKNGFATLLF